MADSGQTEEILIHLQYIRAAQDATNAHLTRLNGRVTKSETDIAVLKDRSDDAKAEGRNWGAGAGAVAGGFVAGFVAVIGQLFGGGK